MCMDKLEAQASTSQQLATSVMNVDYKRHENSGSSTGKERKSMAVRCVRAVANGYINAVYGFLNSRLLI